LTASELVARLERPLPSTLPAGTATAVLVYGVCFHPSDPVEGLELVVDGRRHRPTAFGMPRPDVGGSGLFSGFWATLRLEPREPGATVDVGVAARLRSGTELHAPLAGISVIARDAPVAPGSSSTGLIAVCMATFEPDMALFQAQIDSLRAQTDESWECVISDDCSSAEHFERIEEVVGDDARFRVSRSDNRLGFYRNFERALTMAPPEAELVALCDQDDRWHAEKLSVLRGALGSAQLVYSDQRLVDATGRVLRDTLWKGRRNNHTSLASMLVANTITGAATLFRRELVDLLLPFPDTPGFQFHDHWLGVAALAVGDVAYVDRPLYDYVQHAGAVFGDVTSGGGARRRPRPSLRAPRGFLVSWRAAYFYGYLSREVQAQTLLARCSATLTAGKRATLERFVTADSSPAALGWLAVRPLRALAGRNETLGSEGELARGILWRWLAATSRRLPRRLALDAGFPPLDRFNQKRLKRWRASI
jgi:glycosyltransferase involved in cell wall biosynthesis